MSQKFGLLLLTAFLTACSTGSIDFPVTKSSQENVAKDVTIIQLDDDNIASFSSPTKASRTTSIKASSNWEYRLGVGDVLNIIVFDHPELTLPAGPQRSAEESGFLVQADGSFYYPFIGRVEAKGLSIEDIRADVAKRLMDFVPDPQVVVRVAAFNSQKVLVTGEVVSPNRQALTTTPRTLVEAVNAAGGLKETADASQLTIQRGGTVYNVDFDGFLNAGVRANNPVLVTGDIVRVPRRKTQEAFVLGQIKSPAAVDLSVDPITLTQAIARQGGLNELRADARGVFVFRANGQKMTVFQLETSSPKGMLLGTQFMLEPRDVVYVTRSPLQRWNDTITGLLPTVRSVSAVDGLNG